MKYTKNKKNVVSGLMSSELFGVFRNVQKHRKRFTSSNIQEKYHARLCDALRDLVPFVQFRKREKLPWRSANFSPITESNTPPWVFFI